MNIENFEALKESLKKKGFGDNLNAELEEKMKAGQPEFILEYFAKVKDDEVGYRLHFRHDEKTDKVYFNSYDAAIFHSPFLSEVREQNFQADKLITAGEAYRMLRFGDLVSVNRTLFNKEGQQYNAWLSLDVKGRKDEYGNYPMNMYHENYFKKNPFDLAAALKSIPVPVKELEQPARIADFEKSLKKAGLPSVTMMIDGQEIKGFLSVNPKERKVNLLDENLQVIEVKQQQAAKASVKNNETAADQDEVKKKSGQNQRGVSWSRNSKGISH